MASTADALGHVNIDATGIDVIGAQRSDDALQSLPTKTQPPQCLPSDDALLNTPQIHTDPCVSQTDTSARENTDNNNSCETVGENPSSGVAGGANLSVSVQRVDSNDCQVSVSAESEPGEMNSADMQCQPGDAVDEEDVNEDQPLVEAPRYSVASPTENPSATDEASFEYMGMKATRDFEFKGELAADCLIILRTLDPANYNTCVDDRQTDVDFDTESPEHQQSMLTSMMTILTSPAAKYACPYLSRKISHSQQACPANKLYHYTEVVWHTLVVHERTFGFDSAHTTDMRIAHKLGQYVCDSCSFHTRHPVMFLEHLRHHVTSSPPYCCSSCDELLDSTTMIKHLRVIFGCD